MVRELENLIDNGLVEPPYYVNFVLGMRYQGAVPGTIDNLMTLKAMLPPRSVFNVTGIGPSELPLAVASMLLGGHVRVGMEDNIYYRYYRKEELARSNAQLVSRVVRIARELGLEPAKPDEAREMLGLKKLTEH